LILARKGVRATGGLKAMHVSDKGETDVEAAPHGRAKCYPACAGNFILEAELSIGPGSIHPIGVETICFQ